MHILIIPRRMTRISSASRRNVERKTLKVRSEIFLETIIIVAVTVQKYC